ncbi:MAG: translocation/assembly module TamB domain-containing protein [Spirochaetales bacterium]|nr:translocation/assembly module TamB domain-containing protein [Spirochaetales bacterium]
MDLVREELIGSLEDLIGYNLTYSSISPSIFSYININDLVIYGNNGNDDILAEIGSLKAFYSPFYFFKRNSRQTPLQAVKSFTVTKARFHIDSERDGGIISRLSEKGSGKLKMLPLTTRIAGRSVEFLFSTPGVLFEGKKLFFSMTPDRGTYRIKLNGDVNAKILNGNSFIKEAEASIKANGSVNEFFDSLNFTVATDHFQSDIADLTDQTFQFIFNTGQFELRKVQDNRPIDLVLRHNRATNDWFFSFKSEEFRPDSLITLKGKLSPYSHYSSSRISGNGSILFNTEKNNAVYALDSRIVVNKQVFNRPVAINTDITGDLNQVNVRNLDISTTEGRALFNGNISTESFFPTGIITFVNVETPLGFLINTRISVSHNEGFLTFFTDRIDTGREDIKSVNLVVFPEEKSVTASLEAVLPGIEDINGKIKIDSLIDLDSKTFVNSFVSLKNLPTERLLNLFPINSGIPSLPDDFTDTSVSSEFIVQAGFDDISLLVSDFIVQSNKNIENQLSFTASYNKSGFKINDLYFNWYEYDLNGYINSNRDGDDFLVSTHFDLENKPYRIDAHYSPGQFLLEGDYGLFALVQKSGDRDYKVKLNSKALPVPYNNQFFLADISATGTYVNGDWNIYLEKTGISTDRLFSLSKPEFEITARLDNRGADIFEVLYKDSISSLKGLGRVTYISGEQTSWFSLIDETGRTGEQYDIYFSSESGDIDSRISVISSPLERFRETGLRGTVSFDFGFNGTLDNPEYQAVINTERMNLDGIPVVISTFVRGDRDQVRISDLELEYNGIMFNRGLVMLNLNEGKLIATGAINQIINRSKASISISAYVNTNQSLDIFSLSRLAEINMTGAVTTSPVNWDGLNTFPRLVIDLEKSGQLLSGSIDNGDILSAVYDLKSGNISLNINDLFPFRMSVEGIIKSADVDVQVSHLEFDPSFLNYFMPVDPFRNKRSVIFTSGDVTGDFRIHGPLTDPDYDGRLMINELVPESPFLAEIPEPVSTVVFLEGHSLRINPFSINLNKGEIFVDSSFEFDAGLPTIYNLDVEIRGSEGARVAYAIPGFSWDGHFSGPVHIEGSRSGGFLKGVLTCNNLESSMKSDAVSSPRPAIVKNPSVNGFTVDLTVQTGRDVNFYFPNRQVPIIQATAEKGDDINISYDSRSDELALVGRVDVRTGEINYFNKTFYLQEGYIEFNESQVKFNPKLNVRADVITRDELGEDVTISLLFDDYLLNEFNPEFLSFPRKTENEILALLGQSFIPSNDPEQVSVASVLVATGGMIGKNTIMQPFEEAIKNSLNLDFVSFNTNLIENAILDRFQDQSLYDNGARQVNFARYLEDTSLFIGEYIGEFLFLEGSLVVDYDDSRSVSSTFGGLELNVNLNIQFITPFVLIDWTYDPNNNPDSDYFLPQNTISFTWQYSY